MILKDKTLVNAVAPNVIAGQKQEQDVAFYLRRAYKDHSRVFVINDFSFTHNDETAQIDHLIVYPYGFILIESKSIQGEIKVNEQGEWTRSLNNKWSGMPSPIKQVELQQKLFREFLHEHRSSILPKLFGLKQQSFGLRCWSNICAVSSNAIIERDSMPADISNQVVKSEFLADKLNQVMNLKHKVVSTLTFDTRPDFNDAELKSITDFLLGNCIGKSAKVEKATIEEKVVGSINEKNGNSIYESDLLKCKKCASTDSLSPQSGRYGYFVNCAKCDTNTSMKVGCPVCQSKSTKISKRQETYTLNCLDCDASVQII